MNKSRSSIRPKRKTKKTKTSNLSEVEQKSGSLHLTKKVDYGIYLLIELSKGNGQSLSIKKIAEQNMLSFTFLQKIAGLLLKAKIIQAERGKYGGYSLIKKPQDISLREIIEALEGPISLTRCLKTTCRREKICQVKPVVEQINQDIKDYLLRKSLHAFMV